MLVARGYKVRALSQYNSFNNWGWLEDIDCGDKVEVLTGDIRDPHYCKFITKDIDVIFHLAALIAIPYSYVAPDSYVDTNIKGTLNVVQAARDLGISKVVHTSTSEVYGTAQFVPITEEHPLQGQSPYSATKIGADQIALSFHKSFDTPVTVLRPFNTYGPRQSARAVIPTIITQLGNGKRKIKLGSVLPTRDFNYVAEIKDPLHHLYVMFTKGYYDQNDSKSQKFLPSFLPIDGGDTIHHIRYGHDTTSIDEEGFEIHQKEYPTIWVQSMINYSWWHVGFWSCIVLMGHTVFQRIKNNISVPKEMTFIFCGFSFFIPYLIIDMIRDTFAYYMIYFLPIMATGLVCMIYKTPNKTLRFLVFTAFILAIIGNFLYVFPVWGF